MVWGFDDVVPSMLVVVEFIKFCVSCLWTIYELHFIKLYIFNIIIYHVMDIKACWFIKACIWHLLSMLDANTHVPYHSLHIMFEMLYIFTRTCIIWSLSWCQHPDSSISKDVSKAFKFLLFLTHYNASPVWLLFSSWGEL